MRIVKWAVPLALMVVIIVVSFRAPSANLKPNTPEGMVTTTAPLYYYNEGGTDFNAAAIAPEQRSLALPQEPEAAILALLDEYLDGPQDKSLSPLLSPATAVRWAVKSGDWAGVCFDAAFFTGSVHRDELSLCAVVMTLCQTAFPSGETPIARVSVYVDDVLQRLPGEAGGALGVEDITLRFNAKPLKYAPTVYFPDASMERLHAEERTVDAYLSLTLEDYIMEELLKGPSDEALLPAVPEYVELLSVSTEYGTCYVNLSGEALSVFDGSEASQTMFVYAIVNSLSQVDGVHSVVFLINGREYGEVGRFDLHTRFTARPDLVFTPDEQA